MITGAIQSADSSPVGVSTLRRGVAQTLGRLELGGYAHVGLVHATDEIDPEPPAQVRPPYEQALDPLQERLELFGAVQAAREQQVEPARPRWRCR